MFAGEKRSRLTKRSPPSAQFPGLLLHRSLLSTFLLLLLPISVPPGVGVGLGHRLDGVGSQRPHVTDGV